ncbi:hypothetical protein ACWD7T_34715 [Streptomyces sp. 900116325]
MSTHEPLSLPTCDHRGAPIAPIWDRGHQVDKVINAYARSGTIIDRDVVDLHLLETVDKAACSLLRDQWKDNFPVAAYSELLSTVAALRSILGYSPTPTARDVYDWARSVRDASAEAAGEDKDLHEVRIVEGPYMGAVLTVWGPKAPQAPDTQAGPLLTLELPTERGDTTNLEQGTAHYKRLKRPHPNTGQWEYMLNRGLPFPAEGSRPNMLLAASDQVGA